MLPVVLGRLEQVAARRVVDDGLIVAAVSVDVDRIEELRAAVDAVQVDSRDVGAGIVGLQLVGAGVPGQVGPIVSARVGVAVHDVDVGDGDPIRIFHLEGAVALPGVPDVVAGRVVDLHAVGHGGGFDALDVNDSGKIAEVVNDERIRVVGAGELELGEAGDRDVDGRPDDVIFGSFQDEIASGSREDERVGDAVVGPCAGVVDRRRDGGDGVAQGGDVQTRVGRLRVPQLRRRSREYIVFVPADSAGRVAVNHVDAGVLHQIAEFGWGEVASELLHGQLLGQSDGSGNMGHRHARAVCDAKSASRYRGGDARSRRHDVQ